MTNTTFFFDDHFHKEIYQGIVDVQKNHELMETLILMQTEAGISREQAAHKAALCIAAVVSCESIRMDLADSSVAVVDGLLAQAAKTEDQEQQLHRLYFGLAIYPNLFAQDTGLSTDELFWRYYNENKGCKPISQLEADIRNALTTYRLSPQAIRAMARKIETSKDYLATATALGEGGIAFKCITAMELYLHNPEINTIHEAAGIACTGNEIQAVADRVSKKLMDRELAKKILIIAGITLAVVGIGIVLYQTGKVQGLMAASAKVAEQITQHQTAPIVERTLPAVFSEFAESVKASAQYSLSLNQKKVSLAAQIADSKKLINLGTVMSAFGIGTAALSQKAADLIGKYLVGFTRDGKSAAAGLYNLADYVQHEQETAVCETEETAEETVQQTQTQHTAVTIC